MEELRARLLQAVNESNLPIEAIYYLVKDFYREVDDTYKYYLQQAQVQNAAPQLNEINKEEQE